MNNLTARFNTVLALTHLPKARNK